MKAIIIFSFLFAASLKVNAQCDSLRYKLNRGWKLADRMPELIGGIDSLQQRLHYPVEALKNKIEGKVYVVVLIDSLGKPNCGRILKGIGYDCNREALRLVMTSSYTQAEYRGRKLNVYIAVPVKYKMQ